jgi:arylformamidase
VDAQAAFLEAEYNNRARVPEHPLIIERWNRDAGAFRDGATARLDLSYGTTARTKLDIFLPEVGQPLAIAMFIHGGYWQAFDKSSFSHLARGLLAHQIGVAIPSYDLCPGVRIATIIAQMRQVCLWLLQQYSRPITVFGHSAGGHLAACLLASDWAGGSDPVAAAYAISGLFDLEPLVHTSVNNKLQLSVEEARAFSPIAWRAPAGKFLMAVVGQLESSEYLRQSRSFCATWAVLGAKTRLREVADANHFTILAPLTDPDSAMTGEVAALVHGAIAAGRVE